MAGLGRYRQASTPVAPVGYTVRQAPRNDDTLRKEVLHGKRCTGPSCDINRTDPWPSAILDSGLTMARRSFRQVMSNAAGSRERAVPLCCERPSR